MPVTVQLDIPERLRPAFQSRDTFVVRNDGAGVARRAMLIWLWSQCGRKLWVSPKPRTARAELAEMLAMYPQISISGMEFTTPRELFNATVDYAVIDGCDDELGDVMCWASKGVEKELRLLERAPYVYQRDETLMSLSLEVRKKMLAEIRAGANDEYDEYTVLDTIISESLYEFLLEFWSTVIPESFVSSWYIKYLCDELQKVAERVFDDVQKEYDLLINIAPGTTKSISSSIMFPAWCWKRMASLRFIGASYAHILAMDLSRKNREVVRSPHYQRCSPLLLKMDQNTKTFFMNEQGGMRMGVGTGGIAGFHAHIIGIDDPLDPHKAVSDAELKAANSWIADTLSQRKVDQTKTPTVLIMQRLHQIDPSADMLKRALGTDDVKHICLPAEETDDVQPPELHEFYEDGLLDPQRLPRKTLLEKQKLGMYYYSGQFLQRPTPPGGGMFKWEKMEIMDSVPANIVWAMVVRYWDNAGTDGGGARTAGAKLGKTVKGVYWILDCVLGQWASEQREAIKESTAELDGYEVIIGQEQEPGSSGKDVAETTAKNLSQLGYSVRIDRPTGDKILRADPFSVQVNLGNVKMLRGNWNAAYIDEMRHFPLSEYKDQIDASSGAYKLLSRGKTVIGGKLF